MNSRKSSTLYLTFLEEQLGVEIKIVSVGPDRGQTIERVIQKNNH